MMEAIQFVFDPRFWIMCGCMLGYGFMCYSLGYQKGFEDGRW